MDNVTFYVGGASGTDKLAQVYLVNNGCKVVVCDKGTQNNVIDMIKCDHINGFESYIDRDKFMVNKCSTTIALLKNNVMSLGSGSFRNLVHMHFGEKVAEDFMTHARSKQWDSADECLNAFNLNGIQTLSTTALVI